VIDARRPAAAPRRAASVATLALVLALLAATGVATAQAGGGAVVGDDPRFDVAWRLVAERYWDLSQVAVDWDEAGARYGAWPRTDAGAVDRALEALYAELGDDHSRYVPADQVAAVREELGDLPCVGVFGVATGGAATPIAPLAAFAQGSRADRDGRPVDAPTDLRWSGPVGYGAYPDGIGYVRVADLVRSGTAEGLRTAVRTLDAEGARALVLDLRGNPGGRLVTMMQAAGVFTRGFLWRALTRWSFPLPYPAIGAPATDLPLAILVDGDVHSAAEGLAGALQANGRALVVGATTAGNVEAVLPFCLRDGAQAWLATGVLAPLLGPTWEGRGVEPDLPSPAGRAVDAARAALTRR
jgi:carboxyl-terminal processing protease